MSPSRRSGLGAWLSRLKGYQLVLGFLGLSITVGTAVVAGLTGFERRYGVAATNFGLARTVDVKRDLRALRTETKDDNRKIISEVQRVQLWQLYDQVKRTQRNIDNLKEKAVLTAVEREQLQDFSIQLTEATKDYLKLVEKLKAEPQ